MKIKFGLCCAMMVGAYAQQYIISTVAGGAPPPTPALAINDSIYPPAAITSDLQGNVFFTSNNCVFKLDKTGILTRIAGNSTSGYSGDGGSAADAQLSVPGGLSVDSSGNLLIADSGNQRIRRIGPDGTITTIAGNGTSKFFGPFGDGGPATAAGLGSPAAVVLAGDELYFSEHNGRVRKVARTGIITTVAGGGSDSAGDGEQAIQVRLSDAASIAIDTLGQILIADAANHRVRKISPDGIMTTVAGTGVAGFSGDDGPAALAQISRPVGIAVDGHGNLFIADSGNYRIRKVTSDGVISTFAGGGTTFPGDNVQATRANLCSSVTGVTVDSDGNVYLAACWVQKVSQDGVIKIVSGDGAYSLGGDGGPASQAQLWGPSDVALDGRGNLFVADTNNNLVRMVAPDGTITTVAGISTIGNNLGYSGDGGQATKAKLALPSALAVDAFGNLFISDSRNSRIRKMSVDGVITTVAGNGVPSYSGDGGPATRAGINYPLGICVDQAGNLFIADYQNNVVRKVATDGTISTVAGTGSSGFSGDGGPATSARLFIPRAVAVDPSGNLFIADTLNARVRKVSVDGTISTVVGNGANFFTGDGGLAINASLFSLDGLAVDGDGNLYVADSIPPRIRKVSKDGIIRTIAGAGVLPFSTDGWPAAGLTLNGIVEGLKVDSSGRIYFTDGVGAARFLQPTSNAALIGSVVDAASQRPGPISPGKIIVIYGAGLGPAQRVQNQPRDGIFPAETAGSAVFVNGIPAPVIYTSDTQVTAVVPYAVSGASALVTVRFQGQTSPGFEVPVAIASPGIFSLNGTGAGEAAAVNGDGSVNDAAHPVKAGDYLSLFLTGLGQTTPAGSDGKVASPVEPLAQPLLPVVAQIAGVPANVIYAGAAPTQISGLMQVVVQIPDVQPGGYVPIEVRVGDISTGAGAAWIAVAVK